MKLLKIVFAFITLISLQIAAAQWLHVPPPVEARMTMVVVGGGVPVADASVEIGPLTFASDCTECAGWTAVDWGTVTYTSGVATGSGDLGSAEQWFTYSATALSSVNHYVKADLFYETSDKASINARNNNSGSFYHVELNNGYVILFRVVSNVFTQIDSYSTALTDATAYTVKLSVSGSGATVTVNVYLTDMETPVITYADIDAARLTSGSYVGFGTEKDNNQAVYIDNFEADAL